MSGGNRASENRSAYDPTTDTVKVSMAAGVGAASGTGTAASVNGSASSVTLLAANASRLGATIQNDSAAVLYVLAGAGTASATNYTAALAAASGGLPGGYYEVPSRYTGIIKGIWASATGAARVTEFT